MFTKTLIKFWVAFGILAIVLIFLGLNFVPRIKAFSTVNGNTFDASLRDVSAARWQALGDYYSKYSASVLKFGASLRDVSAARWQALGDYYSKQSALVPNFDANLIRNVSAARWQALGESYLTVNPPEGTSGGCTTLSGYARKYLKASCPAP